MSHKDITSTRGTVEFLREQNELLTVKGEVDPIYEMAGIQKALEGGPALLFENIRGYPGVRNIGNLFCHEPRVAAMFDVADYGQLKFKFLEAIKNPIPPRVVSEAPCQDVVITDNIDVLDILPLIKHSEDDAGRILGSGIVLEMGLDDGKGNDIAFKRILFRGKDWGALHSIPQSHLGHAREVEFKGKTMPLTINIGTPPAVTMVAGGRALHTIVPYGSDELGIAGAVQGSPIEICKARTVDAYAIANAEWVIEGYWTPEPMWETEEAERIGQKRVAPFFPEWEGYQGKATLDYKFQVTAITHRKDGPIFYTPLAHSTELENMHAVTEACYYELAERTVPGLVRDVNILHGLKSGGVVFQVEKRSPEDEGRQRNLLETALALAMIRMAIAVDEDVDIYNADDVLWAIWTRATETGIFRSARGSATMGVIPAKTAAQLRGEEPEGGIAIDATMPWAVKPHFKRIHYPVDKVDLKKWFTQAELDAARAMQSEYARLLAQIGG
ncbi:MAG: UbiD family decarboxylase [Dehalococcoidia bacterium]